MKGQRVVWALALLYLTVSAEVIDVSRAVNMGATMGVAPKLDSKEVSPDLRSSLVKIESEMAPVATGSEAAATQTTTLTAAQTTDRRKAIHAAGTRLSVWFLVISFVFLIQTSLFSYFIRMYSKDKPEPVTNWKGMSIYCDTAECIIIAVGEVIFALLLMIIYGVFIMPRCGSKECHDYRIIGWTGASIISVSLLTTALITVFYPANRSSAFLLQFGIVLSFVITLIMQAAIAAMLSEWVPFVSGGSGPATLDTTISSSMDYIGGAVSAVFGLAVLSSLIPMSEAVMFTMPKSAEDEHHGSDFIGMGPKTRDWFIKWGRVLRVLMPSLSTVGMFWVAMSPIKSENLASLIDEPTRNSWASMHSGVAALAFGTLWLFIIIVTIESCAGRAYQHIAWLGMALSCIAVVGLILGLSYHAEWAEGVFSSSEYLIVFSYVVTAFTRFYKGDMDAIKTALLRWHKK
jgi:hypothetical protein